MDGINIHRNEYQCLSVTLEVVVQYDVTVAIITVTIQSVWFMSWIIRTWTIEQNLVNKDKKLKCVTVTEISDNPVWRRNRPV